MKYIAFTCSESQVLNGVTVAISSIKKSLNKDRDSQCCAKILGYHWLCLSLFYHCAEGGLQESH